MIGYRKAAAIALALAAVPAFAADIVLTPPARSGVSITTSEGNAALRVDPDGGVILNGNLMLASANTLAAGSIMRGAIPWIHSFGSGNAFMGLNAGNFDMTGAQNTGIGRNVLTNNASGSDNSAIGSLALTNNSIGHSNAAFGREALFASTSGNSNTAIGRSALFGNTNGSSNVAVGAGALLGSETGDFNIAIGASAGANSTGNHNILIGHGGALESDVIRIGNNHLKTFISGIRGKTTGSANAVAVVIDSNGQLGTVSSSARFKDDVADMGEATSDLMKLRPVTFHYLADQDPAGRTLQYGLVAEEVAEVYPALVARTPDGQVETVMYQFLPSMLLNEVQKQQRTIDTQAGRIVALEGELAAIKRALGLR